MQQMKYMAIDRLDWLA